MREDLLHYIWKHKKLLFSELHTTAEEKISILDAGTHNHLSGPDFFNARIEIAGQLWAGNVEMHRKSSDWYLHNHGEDNRYQNVILHVVWEDDIHVYRNDNTTIPTLELKKFIPKTVLANYQKLFEKRGKSFINCERDIGEMDPFLISNWLDRLYIEKLENQSARVQQLLAERRHDWEQVFFIFLLKGFGSKINGEAFLNLGKTLNFNIIRKLAGKQLQMESIFLGMGGLLDETGKQDAYQERLRAEYQYLKRKYRLEDSGVCKMEFFKLRPVNFPTIRLSQLATLYASQPNFFSKILETSSLQDFYALFHVAAAPYWNDHYTFGKISGTSPKWVSSKFTDLLLINTVLPIKFCYSSQQGKPGTSDIIDMISSMRPEQNGILDKYDDLNIRCRGARESQALLHLYNDYCRRNKCLSCAVGSKLLSGK